MTTAALSGARLRRGEPQRYDFRATMTTSAMGAVLIQAASRRNATISGRR